VAITVDEVVPLGTRNVHENAPVLFVVRLPCTQLPTGWPPNEKDSKAVETENPVPETVTLDPTGPCIGEATIDASVSVNSAVALSKFPSAPVAVTVYGLAEAVPVIVTEQLKPPVADTVCPQLPMLALPLIVVVTTTPGVNPVPVTVTVAPLGPWVGLSVMLAVVTTNVAVAAS
jgi:hypothetical protein